MFEAGFLYLQSVWNWDLSTSQLFPRFDKSESLSLLIILCNTVL